MSKREVLIDRIRVAGFYGDHGEAIRIYIENRISYQVYKKAFDTGRKQYLASCKSDK